MATVKFVCIVNITNNQNSIMSNSGMLRDFVILQIVEDGCKKLWL